VSPNSHFKRSYAPDEKDIIKRKRNINATIFSTQFSFADSIILNNIEIILKR